MKTTYEQPELWVLECNLTFSLAATSSDRQLEEVEEESGEIIFN